MSRTTARSAAMQMIFEKVSGGQGGEETLKMVYDELRENGVPGERAVGKKEPDEEDRAYISRAFNGVLENLEELDEIIVSTKLSPFLSCTLPSANSPRRISGPFVSSSRGTTAPAFFARSSVFSSMSIFLRRL